MVSNIFYLEKKDVEKILETMNKFPQENKYCLEYSSYGIGSSLDMIIPISIKGQPGEFKVEIFGSDEW